MQFRSQSAMEYLMTYGWAILIIAVILGALYQVGVFNPYTFSPKVGAGACKIARGIVDGQVTSSKVGTCNNALPQYVAQSTGASQYVSLAGTPVLEPQTLSLTVWFKFPALDACYPQIGLNNGAYTQGYSLLLPGCSGGDVHGGVTVGNGIEIYAGSSITPPANAWNFGAITFDGSTESVYVNGALGGQGTVTGVSYSSLSGYLATMPYAGLMLANIQIYNATLTSNEIANLYKEGIGGDPINSAKLVGWWPLNGDAKDYSGNGNDATMTGASFTGSWMAGYAAP